MPQRLLLHLLLLQTSLAVHLAMTPTQLQHFFGTSDRRKVPTYSLEKPNRTDVDETNFVFDVTIDGRYSRFQLRKRTDLFTKEFHVVRRDKNPSLHLHLPVADCVYEGESISHPGSTIALTGCGQNMHGMVINEEGEYHLIQPHHTSGQHIIHKRSLEDMDHSCLFDAANDPHPEDQAESELRSSLMRLVKNVRRAEHRKDVLTIELAVFADDAMWQHFRQMYGTDAEDSMHTFIMAVVNNIDILYTQRSIQPRVSIRIVRYEILKSIPNMMAAERHSSGDADKLLDAFCQYQHEINPPHESDPRHWDHALLFSGYDLYRDGTRTVAGYAPVKGMCSGIRSCTINEGLDFGSVFVVSHEMGHSLGMYHDGNNGCDLGCCIMSPSVGTGKTQWSHCSVNEMTTFVGHLGEDARAPNCLRDSPSTAKQSLAFKDKEPPGQLFTLDEQCEIFHGECWKHELKDGQTLQNVCSMVWCGNGEGIIRTAHPALEGTFCGFGMECRQGQCATTGMMMRVVPGGWSAWNNKPSATCGGTCSKCEIQDQIQLRRSIRQCNNPSTNNGGVPCSGDEARGIVCASEVCSGESIEGYATRICSKLTNVIPNTQLLGQGMQFEQAMCKVWCIVSGSNNIRTVSNFPDGTPCGYGHYCVKGECRRLLCSGTTVAESEADCSKPSSRSQSHSSTTTKSDPPKNSPYKELKKIPFLNEWSGWSAWSDCISFDCRNAGQRVRARRCLAGVCLGTSRERKSCAQQCTGTELATTTSVPEQTFRNRFIAPLPTVVRRPSLKKITNRVEWSPWSGCSVSCGTGQKQRRRKNCLNDCAEVATCVMEDCRVSWTSWSEWSECSVSCGGGLQVRKRACFAQLCTGRDSEVARCSEQDCNAMNIASQNAEKWTDWSAWSSCNASCGGFGVRTRRRRCYKGICRGQQEEKETCRGMRC